MLLKSLFRCKNSLHRVSRIQTARLSSQADKRSGVSRTNSASASRLCLQTTRRTVAGRGVSRRAAGQLFEAWESAALPLEPNAGNKYYLFVNSTEWVRPLFWQHSSAVQANPCSPRCVWKWMLCSPLSFQLCGRGVRTPSRRTVEHSDAWAHAALIPAIGQAAFQWN